MDEPSRRLYAALLLGVMLGVASNLLAQSLLLAYPLSTLQWRLVAALAAVVLVLVLLAARRLLRAGPAA